jgi:arsenate reductase (glutaredoxin)
MAYTLYHYPKCSTCRKAIKFLDENHISYKKIGNRSQVCC